MGAKRFYAGTSQTLWCYKENGVMGCEKLKKQCYKREKARRYEKLMDLCTADGSGLWLSINC